MLLQESKRNSTYEDLYLQIFNEAILFPESVSAIKGSSKSPNQTVSWQKSKRNSTYEHMYLPIFHKATLFPESVSDIKGSSESPIQTARPCVVTSEIRQKWNSAQQRNTKEPRTELCYEINHSNQLEFNGGKSRWKTASIKQKLICRMKRLDILININTKGYQGMQS